MEVSSRKWGDFMNHMVITEERNNGTLVIKPEGRMDTLTSGDLERYLKERYDDCQKLVLDLEKVNYISSAGLRVLLQAHKKMKDREGLFIRSVCPQPKSRLIRTQNAQVH